MKHKSLLPSALALVLVALLLVSCGVSRRPSVAGILTDQATDEPLVGARVVLCQSTGEGNCTLQPQLTAVTSSEGAFRITVPEEDEYVVLYNASGKTSDKWDGLKISLDQDPTVVHSIMESADVETLSVCDFQMVRTRVGPLKVSGFLYSEDLDLTLILIENGLVAVDSEAETSTTLPVWSTQKDECDALFTLSLQADGNLKISSD